VDRDYFVWSDVAEGRDLAPYVWSEGNGAAAYNQVGRKTKRPELAHTSLRGFCFLLAYRADHRDQAHMNRAKVVLPHPELELPHRFDKRRLFDVSHFPPVKTLHEVQRITCATKLYHADVRCPLVTIDGNSCNTFNPFLDGISDMRHHLHKAI
jgi:hypothetical protein